MKDIVWQEVSVWDLVACASYGRQLVWVVEKIGSCFISIIDTTFRRGGSICKDNNIKINF
jgi:hypothetical protein